MRRVSLSALLCASVTMASVAHADEAADNKKRGNALWREAVKQYDLGNFEDATKTYEEAYRLVPSPGILNNLGQAQRQLHNYEKAIFYFRAYLRNAPNAPNAADVQALIVELEKLDAEQKASAGHPPDTVHNPPTTQSAVAAEPPEDRRWYQDPIGWTLAGAGVLAIGLGTGFLVHSNSLSDQSKNNADQSAAKDELDSSHTFQVAGGITIGIGAALVIGGVVKMVLYDRGPHTESKGPEPKANVAFSPSGLVVFGTF